MKKKFLIGSSTIGILLLIILVSMFLPKDFFGYYRDIDMVREEQSKIYDNGVFIHTQKTENRYMDFIVGNDLNVVKIKFKDTGFGPKYRVSSIQTFSDFQDFLEDDIAYYKKYNEPSFSYVSWISEWTAQPKEKVLWAILPAEFSVTDTDATPYKFTYNDEEYVLYIKVEKAD